MKAEQSDAPASQPPLPVAGVRPLRVWWRLAATSSGLTLVFDGVVFAAMGVLGWKLVMPWGDALTAGESLMVIGLIVCAGLWASICADDLYRWRKLCRRWSAQAGRIHRAAAPAEADAPALASHEPADAPVAARPRVRSAVLPSHRASRAMSHTPWHVVTRH